MGRIVIVAYRPKPGREDDLKELMRGHLPTLQEQNLVTDRPSIMMEARDGTIVEVFEWRSAEAMASAHSNPAVLEMWKAYAQVCDYVPVAEIEEAGELFSEFAPL